MLSSMANKFAFFLLLLHQFNSIATYDLDCPLGLEERLVCRGSKPPACGQTLVKPTAYCRKIKVCRCPATSPFWWSSRYQCYKKFECPKKSHDTPSDKRSGHKFVIPGTLRRDGQIYVTHIAILKSSAHWYHAVASLRLEQRSCIVAVQRAHAKNPRSFLTLEYMVPVKLVDLLAKGKRFTAIIGLGFRKKLKFFKNCVVRVEKVLDMRRLKADQPYPRYQKYFLAGNRRNAFMTHIPTKCKDFQQTVSLKSAPRAIRTSELMRGVVVEIPSLSGKPTLDKKKKIVDPLKKKSYRIMSAGQCCDTEKITIGKKYIMDSHIINLGC